VGEGFGEVFRGDFGDGFKDIGGGLFRATVEAEIDATLIDLRQKISAVQTVFHAEEPSRGLNDAEIAQLRKVFGDEVDFSQVRIKEGPAGVAHLFDQGRAFTNGNTIYMEKDASDPAFMS